MTRSGRSSMIHNVTEEQERIMMKIPLQARCRIVVFALFVSFALCLPSTEAFSTNAFANCQRHQGNAVVNGNVRIPLPSLFAKKKSSKARASGSTGGFGGAATEPCVCGSGLGYNKCCGKLHQDSKAYAAATASQVVRARYSGYSKRVIDFIIASTHPLNPSFEQDMSHWKKTMEEDCFDNFELTKCDILEESYSGEGTDELATVRFRTQMTQRDTEERSAFIETSTFERDPKSGAWLYRDGVVASVDPATKEE
jgi:SEC-C motif-containing protein